MNGQAVAAPYLVFGASGQVGRQVLARCRAARQDVVALSRHARKPSDSPHIRWMGARLPDAVPPLPPVSAVLSLGPLDLFADWLAQWQPMAGAPFIVALSSMSAVSKAESRHPGERHLAMRMRDAEARMATRCDHLGLPWLVLRPTMLWGVRMDRTLSPLARMAMRWRWMPVPRAQGQRQPVHVDDVAAAVLACVRRGRVSGRRIECGGGERLSVTDLFQRVRASIPQRTLGIPVPGACLRSLGSLARFSGLAAAVGRLNDDLLADNSQLETLLGINPRGFAPTFDDWLPPSSGD